MRRPEQIDRNEELLGEFQLTDAFYDEPGNEHFARITPSRLGLLRGKVAEDRWHEIQYGKTLPLDCEIDPIYPSAEA